ncbi:hypothetical protein AVEN_84268-1 [Araneus ventricosus]|uniref:Uncharacterized protein n=1 Tax=Araneus ventricosus TaxID=182803 RepID=A0A4Y2UL84_ARAVE|nr:hypothetical protein AVEN_84268-1 [Araneus ventricosus]
MFHNSAVFCKTSRNIRLCGQITVMMQLSRRFDSGYGQLFCCTFMSAATFLYACFNCFAKLSRNIRLCGHHRSMQLNEGLSVGVMTMFCNTGVRCHVFICMLTTVSANFVTFSDLWSPSPRCNIHDGFICCYDNVLLRNIWWVRFSRFHMYAHNHISCKLSLLFVTFDLLCRRRCNIHGVSSVISRTMFCQKISVSAAAVFIYVMLTTVSCGKTFRNTSISCGRHRHI